MELQFEKRTLDCLRRVVWEAKNEEQTQEVRLGDAMPDIGRVLGCWGQPMIRSKDWRGNGMSVSGGVMCWVLYAPEDGTAFRTVESWIPFQLRWDFPQTQHDGSIRLCCNLRGADARAVSARKLMIRAALSVMGEALEPVKGEVYSPEQVPEDVQLLKKNYPVCLMKEAGEKVFSLEEELKPPASSGHEKLLRYELQPEIIDRKVMGDKVVFRGCAIVHAVFLGEDGDIKSWDCEVPFSQFAQLDREYDDGAQADVIPALSALELDLTGDGPLTLKATLVGQYLVWDRVMLELVEDAYSPVRSVGVQEQALTLPVLLEYRRETVELEAEMEIPGEVIDVSFGVEQPRVSVGQDKIRMELPGSFQVLSQQEGGMLQGHSTAAEAAVELPAAASATVVGRAVVSGRATVHPGSGKTRAVCDGALDIFTVTEGGLSAVTGLELGELRQPDPQRPSLILRRAGCDSLWQVAKQAGSTVEAIRRANALEEEPAPERMLLIPIA